MSLAPYRRLLAARDVRRLLAFGVLARIPHTAAWLVLTLHVVSGLDRGYAAAGLVREARPGAVAELSAALVTPTIPACSMIF